MLVIPQSAVNDILKKKELTPIIGHSLIVDTVLVLKAKVVTDSRVNALPSFSESLKDLFSKIRTRAD